MYILFLQECKGTRDQYKPPEGFTLVADSLLDSLELVASQLADTVYRDTGTTRVIREYHDRSVPVPTPVDPKVNYYQDSIKSDTVDFWIDALIRGTLEDWNWKFDIIQNEIVKVVEVPKPVPVKLEIPVVELGLYVGLRVGGGSRSGEFMYGAELDYLNRKHNIYGIQYSSFGHENIIGFKIGTRILQW